MANCECADNRSDEHLDAITKSKFGSLKYKRLVLMASIASVSTAILLVSMKLVVWIISGSSAVFGSFMDSGIDMMASLISLLALRYAMMPADRDHRFGHYKAEALASLTQAAFICGSSIFLLHTGYSQLVDPQPIAYIAEAILVSVISIVLTICLTVFQGYVCKYTKSQAIAADRLHYISDLGINASVILSLWMYYEGWLWGDGLIAIGLGFYIMLSSYHIGRQAISTLLDHALSMEDTNKIMQAILSVKGIDSFHDLRTRQAGPQIYVQCHIVLKSDMPLSEAHKLADEAERNILASFPDSVITLHMEPESNDTYKDITFIDEQYCQVPPSHYIKCDVPETLYRKIHARHGEEAVEPNSETGALRTDPRLGNSQGSGEANVTVAAKSS